MLQAKTHGRTDRGQKRSKNEDQFLVALLTRALSVQESSLSHPELLFGQEQGLLMIVADGLGGHAAGELASRLAVRSIEEFMLNTLKWFFALRGNGVLLEFPAALQGADDRIFETAAQRPELRGMGTTVTMAYAIGGVLYVAHAGDSRCYISRQGHLYRITTDHTLTEELALRGRLNREELARSPFRNVITNAVGGNEPGVKVEVHKVELEAEDVVLLCSDGVTAMLTDDEVEAIVGGDADADAACDELIARANDAGGDDNITAIVARFDEPHVEEVELSAEPQTEAVAVNGAALEG